MESFWETLKQNLKNLNLYIYNIPLQGIVAVVIIFTIIVMLRGVFFKLVINRIERFTQRTNTTLDDELIEILKPPLGWLFFVAGLWLVQIVIAQYLSQEIKKIVSDFISLSITVTIAYIIYRSAPLLGELLKNWTARTETELDDLLAPYLPKIFRIAAIVVVVIKISELLLGASAGAIIGLLGGAGVALGLLVKDIIYDLCCTVIIYSDRLFRPGDVVRLDGIDDRVRVAEIGLRSTSIYISKRDSIKKIPNSKMVSGIVENLSQNPRNEDSHGIVLKLKIDGISANKTARICARIRELPKSIDSLHNRSLVFFRELEGNARVIEIRVYAEEGNSQAYYGTWHKLNIAILAVLEKEGIDLLNVFLRTDPEGYKQIRENINN